MSTPESFLRSRPSKPAPCQALREGLVIPASPVRAAAGATAGRGARGGLRYELVVRLPGDSREPTLRVFDHGRRRVLLSWRGAAARHLLGSGVLPRDLARAGRCRCDKWFVWHLVLLAATTRIALDQIENSRPGARRAPLTLSGAGASRSRAVVLTDTHRQIIRLLSSRPAQRFSSDDICCLMLLHYPSLSTRRVSAHLDELVQRKVVEQVDTEQGRCFYMRL